ncbi:glucosamine-6-phosphate deaminase [Calidifontibacillus oryziterrae]|uniref:glucosamine-6-phosphate deaminase n=1 Tax=Calidifontibacillus oryziterrae TaxID=1191699 RepID=UPI00030D5CA2|nr:glucosamine-6-phosphate deaminase [Calidifontibacillus oryziterrae]
MNTNITENYEQLCKASADILYNYIKENPFAVLALPTGNTPIGVYEKLIELNRQNPLNWENIKIFNLDEYVGLAHDSEQSFRSFMERHLYSKLNIPKENTFIPNGNAKNLEEECLEYETKIKEAGGIDLAVLGVGVNGHIGFNEPKTRFDQKTSVVTISEHTRQVNSKDFHSLEEVPKTAITMGISTIMGAKKIILLASGTSKSVALKSLIEGPITEEFPVTVLRRHHDVTVIADRDSYSF